MVEGNKFLFLGACLARGYLFFSFSLDLLVGIASSLALGVHYHYGLYWLGWFWPLPLCPRLCNGYMLLFFIFFFLKQMLLSLIPGLYRHWKGVDHKISIILTNKGIHYRNASHPIQRPSQCPLSFSGAIGAKERIKTERILVRPLLRNFDSKYLMLENEVSSLIITDLWSNRSASLFFKGYN